MKRKLLFIGPVLTASGYGVHSRQLLRALVDADDFDIHVESLRWGETGFLPDQSLDWIRQLVAKGVPERVDVAIQVSIANEFRRRAPLTIGVTAGIEVDRVSPQWLARCNAEVDLVIVPSEHSRRAFLVEYGGPSGEKLRLEKSIFVLAEGVDTSTYRPNAVNSGILDKLEVSQKNFVCVGLGLDKPRGRDRKNITTLVEWFCRTFQGNADVGLVLKTSIVNSTTIDFEITKKRIDEIKRSVVGDSPTPRIHLLHGRLEEFDLAAIYNDPRVTAMVSLTHGEGFGLPLLEAAACGLPIMATDWSGHLDFLTKDGRKLFVPIEYDLAELYPECVWEGVMDAGTRWAIPREADACMKMQKMVLSAATPRQWSAELATHVAERYSLEVTGRPFAALVRGAAEEMAALRPPNREDFIAALRAKVRQQGPSLIYTMPMSAGDVFLSTGVIHSLRRKHPGHRVYLATGGKYFDIVRGLTVTALSSEMLVDELIEWQPWMQDVSILEDVFDQVYTPNLAVQMTWSNWVHGGRGRHLLDEFAVQCGVVAMEPVLPTLDQESPRNDQSPPKVVVHVGGQKSARAYAHWDAIVKNLRDSGITVVQVGAADDTELRCDLDLRGKTDHRGLVQYLATCDAFVGIDSYPMHVATFLAKPVIALFGSSYPGSTGPYPPRNRLYLRTIETADRNGCERACYKDTCKVDGSNPCINNIRPQDVFHAVTEILGYDQPLPWQDFRPKISGYTHILNPVTHGYPYLQSIQSMLGFCDEVIVVDGGSTDDSLRDLDELIISSTGRLKLITREWDPLEPGMDGMQKAFARAMVSPDAEFLWQQDADEVVREEDYDKILDVCRRFPRDVDVVHLPVVELWGDQTTCRTDRHSWKWRLTRNNLRITHGINQAARLMDPKTGRFYAKKGESDGCELIDIVTAEHLPHRGFYTGELEQVRRQDPIEYGRRMNEIFGKLPSVWHYSWADLSRKVRNFRDFWDKQWQVLYQTAPEPRFPEVITDFDIDVKAEQLRLQGGEHAKSQTFGLTVSPPRIMEGWGAR